MKTQEFKAQARDKGGDWVVVKTGSPQECRSAVVAGAGFMVQNGWVVTGMNRSEITVQDPDDEARRTEFRVSRVVSP